MAASEDEVLLSERSNVDELDWVPLKLTLVEYPEVKYSFLWFHFLKFYFLMDSMIKNLNFGCDDV